MRVVPTLIIGLAGAAFVAGCAQTQTSEAPLSPEAREHVGEMAAEAQAIITLLKDRASSTHTPEFVQLRLDWDERLFDAQMKLDPDKHGTWISERATSTNAIAHEAETRGNLDPEATRDIVHYATAEITRLQAADAGDKKGAGSAQVDMASDAAHAALDLRQVDDARSRSIAWRTLLAKWDWRAATGALETALPEMKPDAIADEWIGMARQKRDSVTVGAADSGNGTFVEDFNLARMQSVKAAMQGNDKAVASAGVTMASAAQTGLDLMDRQTNQFFAVPENLATYLDWSHKLMEADALVHHDTASRRAAIEAFAQRVRRMEQKMAAAPDELASHILKYAEVEAEYQLALLK